MTSFRMHTRFFNFQTNNFISVSMSLKVPILPKLPDITNFFIIWPIHYTVQGEQYFFIFVNRRYRALLAIWRHKLIITFDNKIRVSVRNDVIISKVTFDFIRSLTIGLNDVKYQNVHNYALYQTQLNTNSKSRFGKFNLAILITKKWRHS